MEPDEISVVLQRASELHAKISDAIARALKSEFLLTTKGNGGSGGSPGEDSPGANGDELSGEVNAEAKSLSGIRDALETLEEQLECLQTLQYQQRAEKDAALAELEESRRILLNRLKNHRGKEWEVVHEALAFAGEPVEDRDDLPLPPYAMPLPEPRSNSDQRSASFGRYNSSTVEASDHSSATKQRDGQHHQEGVRAGFFRLPFKLDLGGLAGRLFGPGLGVTSKAAIIVASVITIILFSELGTRKDSRRTKSRKHSTAPVEAAAAASTAVPTLPEPAPCPRPSDFEERCPPGKVMIIQDGVPKCVVKERIEIPFHPGVSSPDVLYGRG